MRSSSLARGGASPRGGRRARRARRARRRCARAPRRLEAGLGDRRLEVGRDGTAAAMGFVSTCSSSFFALRRPPSSPRLEHVDRRRHVLERDDVAARLLLGDVERVGRARVVHVVNLADGVKYTVGLAEAEPAAVSAVRNARWPSVPSASATVESPASVGDAEHGRRRRRCGRLRRRGGGGCMRVRRAVARGGSVGASLPRARPPPSRVPGASSMAGRRGASSLPPRTPITSRKPMAPRPSPIARCWRTGVTGQRLPPRPGGGNRGREGAASGGRGRVPFAALGWYARPLWTNTSRQLLVQRARALREAGVRPGRAAPRTGAQERRQVRRRARHARRHRAQRAAATSTPRSTSSAPSR